MFETFAVLADIEPLFTQLEKWAREDAGMDLSTQEHSALAVLMEFAEDIRAAFGTGIGNAIDEERLDWSDLVKTYYRAVDILNRPTHDDSTQAS